MRFLGRRETAEILRMALFALVVLGIVGSGIELAHERHWDGFWQLLPWAAIGGLCLALLALLFRTTTSTIWLARVMAAGTIVISAIGVWQHVAENYDTAPLDAGYTESWDSMLEIERWWAVASGSVGPAPVLAAGILLYCGVALAAATVGMSAPRPVRSRPVWEP